MPLACSENKIEPGRQQTQRAPDWSTHAITLPPPAAAWRGRWLMITAAVFLCSAAAQEPGTRTGGATAEPRFDRPYPIIEVQIGDVPIGVPEYWIEGPIAARINPRGTFLILANTGNRNDSYFGFPRLTQFLLSAGNGLLEPRKTLAAENQSSDQPLKANFLKLRPTKNAAFVGTNYLYMLPTNRPLNQPFIVNCVSRSVPHRPKNERQCRVFLSWTTSAGVRYTFWESDNPITTWSDIDQRVIDTMKILDLRKPFHSEPHQR